MRLYITAKTNFTNDDELTIDYIAVRLKNGETVSLNWDESDFGIEDGIFIARYKGVYFDDTYANGKIDELNDMKVTEIGFYSETNKPLDFIITDMEFEDDDKELSFETPFVMLKDEIVSEGLQLKKEKFYEISITHGPDDGDGYSIFIDSVIDKEDVIGYAQKYNLFHEPEDVNFIDSVNEITRKEYEEWTGRRAHNSESYFVYKDWRIFEENGKFTFGTEENASFSDCTLENCCGTEELLVDLCLKMNVHLDYYVYVGEDEETLKGYLNSLKDYDPDESFIVPAAVFDSIGDVKAFLDVYEKERKAYWKQEFENGVHNRDKFTQLFEIHYSENDEAKNFVAVYPHRSPLNIYSFANEAADYFYANYSSKEERDAAIESIGDFVITTEKNGEYYDVDSLLGVEDIFSAFIERMYELMPEESQKKPIYVQKMIGGELCKCENVNHSGKMRFELECTFDDDFTRKEYMLVPIELSEKALETLSDLWLTEEEKRWGYEVGSSCTSSSWWAGSDDPKKDSYITSNYDHLIHQVLGIQPVIPDIHGMHLYNLEGHVFGEMAGYITGELFVDDVSLDFLFRVKDDANGTPMTLVSVDYGHLHPAVGEYWDAIERALKNHAEKWCSKLDVLLEVNKFSLPVKQQSGKIQSAKGRVKSKKTYGIAKNDLER